MDTPTFRSVEQRQRVRTLLAAIGYDRAGVLEATGCSTLAQVEQMPPDVLARRLSMGAPIEAFIRLFIRGIDEDRASLEGAIDGLDVAEWEQIGLVACDGDRVRATVRLVPRRHLLFAFDRPEHAVSDRAADYVMGPAPGTLSFANLLLQASGGTVLDLGTGCGVLALLLAEHAEQVHALDLNSRATAYARFNVELNGIDNVEVAAGDLFEPVSGRAFDLIACNPPYVISPSTHFVYRDDSSLTRRIVREAPAHLRPGGVCQLIANWPVHRGRDWRTELGQWFEGCGCDAWILHARTQPALEYAIEWIDQTEVRGDPDHERATRAEWMRFYESEGIDAIGQGYFFLRKRDADAHFFDVSDAPPKMIGPCGEAVVRGFAARDFLAAHREPAALLDATLRFDAAVTLTERKRPADGDWTVEAANLRLGRGFAYSADLDPDLAAGLRAFARPRRVRDVMDEIAVRLETTKQTVYEQGLPVIRWLIEATLLVPPD